MWLARRGASSAQTLHGISCNASSARIAAAVHSIARLARHDVVIDTGFPAVELHGVAGGDSVVPQTRAPLGHRHGRA